MQASSLRRPPGRELLQLDHFVDVHAHYLPAFYVSAMRQAGTTDVDGMPIRTGTST